MPTKFQLITELYDQTVQSVTGSYQSWTGFLRAACYNYKCPFDDQILIYAQRPDATAVLEMERWNRQFGRWVNRGAKSIAVFGDDGQNCLKLYFDVSDTHASRFARPLPIWTMHPAFEPEVIETLEATFGNLSEKKIWRTPCAPPATTPWRTTSRTTCKTCGSAGRTACWRNWMTSIWRRSTGTRWRSAWPIC